MDVQGCTGIYMDKQGCLGMSCYARGHSGMSRVGIYRCLWMFKDLCECPRMSVEVLDCLWKSCNV